jgi:hypothetical protein
MAVAAHRLKLKLLPIGKILNPSRVSIGMLALVRADDQMEVLPGKKESKSRRPLT